MSFLFTAHLLFHKIVLDDFFEGDILRGFADWPGVLVGLVEGVFRVYLAEKDSKKS